VLLLVRSFILYYLNIKPTHGYEIQKFLQISGVDSWTKIQSGSIYYALSKLEKEGCLEVLKEEKTGARIRKIYQITENGRQELQHSIQNELRTPIVPAGSDKFLLSSILDALPKEVIETNLKSHLKTLIEQKEYWEEWKEKKCSGNQSMKADRIAFDMTIASQKYQILWHEELLKNIDEYMHLGEGTRQLIMSVDFSDIETDLPNTSDLETDLLKLQNLREEILQNPEKAAESIDELISKLQLKK